MRISAKLWREISVIATHRRGLTTPNYDAIFGR
jgi:hypothetical protein